MVLQAVLLLLCRPYTFNYRIMLPISTHIVFLKVPTGHVMSLSLSFPFYLFFLPSLSLPPPVSLCWSLSWSLSLSLPLTHFRFQVTGDGSVARNHLLVRGCLRGWATSATHWQAERMQVPESHGEIYLRVMQ